jgi:hypothetical protein
MPEVECPSCGGFGTIPKDKVNDRLVCRKCHVVFHVTPAGRSVLGEPKAEAEAHPHGHPHAHGVAKGAGGGFTLSPRTAQIGAGVIAVLVLFYFVGRPLLGGGKSLEATARDLAKQMAAGNNVGVGQMSADDSLSDTNLWYQMVRPILDEMKQDVPDHTLDIALTERGYGRLAIFFGTAHSSERTSAITKAAAAAPSRTSLEVPTYWERDGFGNWRIDGKRTLAVVPSGR